MQRRLRAFARKHSWTDQFDIYIGERLENGRTAAIKEVIFQEIQEGMIAPDSPLHLTPEAAQELMDSFWQCGLRPSEGSGSAGSLKATQDNLKDLRGLADRLLTIVERKS